MKMWKVNDDNNDNHGQRTNFDQKSFIRTDLNPFHPMMLCAKFEWDSPSGSEEEDENVKSLQTDEQTDWQTDDGRQVIRKSHLSF